MDRNSLAERLHLGTQEELDVEMATQVCLSTTISGLIILLSTSGHMIHGNAEVRFVAEHDTMPQVAFRFQCCGRSRKKETRSPSLLMMINLLQKTCQQKIPGMRQLQAVESVELKMVREPFLNKA